MAQQQEGTAMVAVTGASSAGTAGVLAREQAEVRAGMELARVMPRDVQRAETALLSICRSRSFAETALYSFPRGDSEITGPSVRLAREAARCWGNLRAGMRVLAADQNEAHIGFVAIDLETGFTLYAEDRFQFKILRKQGRGALAKAAWIECKDEREIRELVNRRAALLERNVLLRMMPASVVEAAVAEVEKTMAAPEPSATVTGTATATEATANRWANLRAAFEKLGVREMQLLRWGDVAALEDLTEAQVQQLRKIRAGLIDGVTTVDEVFVSDTPVDEAKPVGESGPMAPLG